MVRKPEYDLRAFAHGLRLIMAAEEISCTMLSEWAGVGKDTVSDWRNAVSLPKPHNIIKIEEIFRLPISEIVRVGKGGGYGKKT